MSHFDLLVLRILEVWFLMLGFQPSSDWDANDPACLRDYGPYRVWTVMASIPNGALLDRQVLFEHLHCYLQQLSKFSGQIRLGVYDIQLYNGCIFISVYHPL